MDIQSQSRRHFLQASGALVVAFSFQSDFAAAQPKPARLPGSLATNPSLDAWIRIGADGRVTIFTGKIELGQGIGTALAQIAADELDVDIGRIDMVHGDTERTPNEGQTAGSLSVTNSGQALRHACAEARQLLLSAAGAKLGAEAAALTVRDGRIVAPDGPATDYWQLAQALDLRRNATGQVKPKAHTEYRYVGTSVPRRDVPAKFTGAPVYVQDIRLPGMVHGRVVRPPSPRARLTSLDEAAIRSLPGLVALVRDGNFVAVAAEREEQAIAAREALAKAARWEEHATLPPADDALYEHLMAADVPAVSVARKSDPAGTPVKKLQALYARPFQVHASIGPSCALAQWQDGKLTVWTHSQGVFPLQGELARAFGVEPKAIHCIHAEGSGCYGHNGADDVAFDAAMLARASDGRPVRVQWMRDDEFAWEPYGSAMAMRMSGGIDADGRVVEWRHELWSHPHSTRPGGRGEGVNLRGAWLLAQPQAPRTPADGALPAGGSDRNAVPGYDFPNFEVLKHYIVETPLRTSALRTLGAYANVFALESFLDELAIAAGVDPLEFRLRHLSDPRGRAVIEAAAQRAGWQPNARGNGREGRGIAYARYKNLACYCAVVADVSVDRASGTIRLTRAVAAVDAGQVVNPDGVSNQIEGGLIQSASWTLKEALAFDRTRVATRSWNEYPILRFEEVPKVEVVVLDRPGAPFLGVGEGSQGPTAAAIGNAVAHATGKRLRALPFSPQRVQRMLA
jgi:CO/xanthine dehydrogenase Mo-binding subunit